MIDFDYFAQVWPSLLKICGGVVAIGFLLGATPPPPYCQKDAHHIIEPLSADKISDWRESFQDKALEAGLSEAFLDKVFADFTIDMDAVRASHCQPESLRKTGVYVNILVSQKRIALGQKMLIEHRALFEKIERLYGVDRHILAAIWGIETNYGQTMGRYDVVRALASLAIDGRRRPFAEKQLLALLSTLDEDGFDIHNLQVKGSWAGAMGHMQFIPTTYADYARDVDQDGKRDIWHNLADSLGSAAYFLKRSGWQVGLFWGLEVVLPDDFDKKSYDFKHRQPLSQWWREGWRVAQGKDARADIWKDKKARLFWDRDEVIPSFIVTKNFDALLKYNHSYSYALAVGHLADRLRGAPQTMLSWVKPPTPPEKPLTRDEIIIAQILLNDMGFDAGKADGLIGKKTYKALYQWQKKMNFEKAPLTRKIFYRISRQATRLSLEEIKMLQSHLTDLGFDAGGVDGFFGQKTRRALRLWQEKSGMAVNGHPNHAILTSLSQQAKQGDRIGETSRAKSNQ